MVMSTGHLSPARTKANVTTLQRFLAEMKEEKLYLILQKIVVINSNQRINQNNAICRRRLEGNSWNRQTKFTKERLVYFRRRL